MSRTMTRGPRLRLSQALLILLALAASGGALWSAEADYHVGLARVDITPDYPIRLNGFGNRRAESEGVSQKIFARAMAVSQGDEPPLVLVAIDSLGIRLTHVEEVAAALRQRHDLPRENLAVTFTHSHCTPKVNGASDNIFSQEVPPEHQAHIDRYTKQIVEGMIDAASQAIRGRRPSTLEWSVGTVKFAKNRRTPGGPVDHDLPTLVVRDAEGGKVRGVYVSYACHCVTLSFNKISGDWAGYAAELLEQRHPGAVALVSIGAGSDANPIPGVQGDKVEIAREQGAEIAAEVKRLIDAGQKSLSGAPAAVLRQISLPLDDLPSREELEETASGGRRPTDRYNATTQLARLDRGEPLLAEIAYPIQTWTFGDQLCMVFLAGEVCVDYSIRLKQELDRERFWLNAYSNDFGCYVPSERLVREGGYGGGAETPYFALPTTLKAGLEQRIVDEVKRQVPKAFHVPRGVQGVAPKSPADALDCFRLADPKLRIQLAAAEPLVRDPVAIDFGADGSLWVAEMSDYGRGVYESFEPTGRIRRLVDQDGDGVMDRAETFIDGLRFPTDVKAWQDGVLICDAPSILLARDTDGDGRADSKETLYSGFEVRNAQARVNSLRWGLDNWIHGACGLFGGAIRSSRTGELTQLASRDFRLRPSTGEIEAASGRTQQGRSRNDWGDWFGCTNSSLLLLHGPADRYLSRNPRASGRPGSVLNLDPDAQRLIPAGQLVRFELSGQPGKATAACGLDIHRDPRWAGDYDGSALVCEPVHQLVHRIALHREDLVVRGRRGDGEEGREFLASTDRWFRPVQVRMGPDGAVWVVDMYRYVIEHSRWIPQATLAELDVMAGRQRGRIYRVVHENVGRANEHAGSGWSLESHQLADLVAELAGANGVRRDLAHQLLVWRADGKVVPAVRRLALDPRTSSPGVVQALAVLSGLRDGLDAEWLERLLSHAEHAEVLRHATRHAEGLLNDSPELRRSIFRLRRHPAARVRQQVAWSLGEADSPDVAAVLAELASRSEPEEAVRAAALTSLQTHNVAGVLDAYLSLAPETRDSSTLRVLVRTAVEAGDGATVVKAFDTLLDDGEEAGRSIYSDALFAAALESADRRAEETRRMPALPGPLLRRGHHRIAVALRRLRSESLDEQQRRQVLTLLGRRPGEVTRDMFAAGDSQIDVAQVMAAVASGIFGRRPEAIQLASVEALSSMGHVEGAELLLGRYSLATPAARAAILDAVLTRDDWIRVMLEQMEEGKLRVSTLSAAQRAQLARHPQPQVRELAAKVLGDPSASRAAVVESYLPALQLEGDASRGRGVFRSKCSSCHRLEEHGVNVGPDLAALTNRDPQWLLTTILDPNQAVDARYFSWSARLQDGRVLSGMLVSETTSAVHLREAGGKDHRLARSELENLRCSEVSVMPEGLERELSWQEVRDVIAYLRKPEFAAASPAEGAVASDVSLPRYPPQIAPFLLDQRQAVERRQEAIDQRPGMGPAIIAQLTGGFESLDAAEQKRRIPWIWRTALAVGKRNDGGEIRDLLDVSLPAADQRLEHWQAVAIGGGLINGLTQVGRWPRERIEEVLGGAESIASRWPRALAAAGPLADDEQAPAGIRYDALRMLGMLDPKDALPPLQKYLGEGVDRELQMGAVSGLGDIDHPDAGRALIDALRHLEGRNRRLALEALLRTEHRAAALQRATENGEAQIAADDLAWLQSHEDKDVKRRAGVAKP